MPDGLVCTCGQDPHRYDCAVYGPVKITRTEAQQRIRAERAADPGYRAPGDSDWRDQAEADVEELSGGDVQ